MLVGNPDMFAVNYEILILGEGEWVFGSLVFIAQNQIIGDWTTTVTLDGCVGWMEDFVGNPRDRYEPELEFLQKEKIIKLLIDYDVEKFGYEGPFKNTYGRFVLVRLGMDAFIDTLNIVLLEEPKQQRLIWRTFADMRVYEAVLPVGEMQAVLSECCRVYYKDLALKREEFVAGGLAKTKLTALVRQVLLEGVPNMYEVDPAPASRVSLAFQSRVYPERYTWINLGISHMPEYLEQLEEPSEWNSNYQIFIQLMEGEFSYRSEKPGKEYVSSSLEEAVQIVDRWLNKLD